MTRNLSGLLGLIAYLLFFAWLDWITHRSIAFIVVVGGGILFAAMFRTGIAEVCRTLSLRDSSGWTSRILNGWSRLPWHVRRLIVALTPLFYFLLRGQGTSGAGGTVFFGGLVVVAPVILLGDQLDRILRGYYEQRDRFLPRWVRLILAPVLAVLIAFVVVHGSLLDLPALFGGTTTAAQSPAGLGGRFFLATLLAGICSVLLVREGSGT
jgi:hypothetical protein